MSKRIGIFDSGLGGLTVLRELRQVMNGCEFVYLGDTARTPYGTKSESTIVRYALGCTQFLLAQEVDMLVVACNTASSWALEAISEVASCPVVGTIEPVVREVATLRESVKSIGVIGTTATIGSSIYEQKLTREYPELEVISKACPLFVPLVEEGMFTGEIVERVIAYYLQPFREANVDALILACTHYPLLIPAIQRYVGEAVNIIECSPAIGREILQLFGKDLSENAANESGVKYFVTDEVSRFNSLAAGLLNGDTVTAVKIELS